MALGAPAMEDTPGGGDAVVLGLAAYVHSEPVAAIGYPPADPNNGDGRAQRPPERKQHVGEHAEQCEADPENLALHAVIVFLGFPFAGQTYTTVP
jgi:hypothetical protein